MRHGWALAAILVAGSACHTAAPAAPPPAPAAPAAAASRSPSERAVRWARVSAEHQAIYVEVFAMATAHVEQAAAGRAPGSWAVVSDADDTLLDNSEYQLERVPFGGTFDPKTWRVWTARRAAVPLPGAAAFLRRVHELGGRIAIVTNRDAVECPDTEDVFRAHALPYDVILCKPEGASSDKNPRFEAIARGAAGLPPVEIVAFLGDNIQDFPGQTQAIRQQGDAAFAEFGRRFFVFPNAMYGSWERN